MRTLPKNVAGRVRKGIRAFLGWDQSDLTEKAKISLNTIRNFENDKTETHQSSILSVSTAFEENGVKVEHREDSKEVIVTYKYDS